MSDDKSESFYNINSLEHLPYNEIMISEKSKNEKNMLSIQNVKLQFGSLPVLDNVCYCFHKNRVYTLSGGNGAGKTTLFNVISGFLKPNSGDILFQNRNITKLPSYRINRIGIGRTFQDLRLAMHLTALENVLLASSHKMFEHYTEEHLEKAHHILNRVSLEDKANACAGEISYGQQKLLTLACLLANNAELLLIDEPVAGIDKSNLMKIVDLVSELKAEGKTIIQIEHHPDYIVATNDVLIRMENGKIIC
ncbi:MULTISPECIES: ATP-binding cassette domain-containing protein [Bacteroides]|uniref:ATP-binding cassette domain-containing protein n=1 Tax=Bacteroides TaxID=816 RepID=UPI00189DA4C0|nr:MULTISPECIES: ATP-binding cassette domain-containing protein [Bacteroides]MDC1767433.1 ATP-binding cassette domain-containing protein [Bacteroides uniformis]MDC1771057.1 ATP-binding cassette domain-containing protein [Bacteroides uniformis]MDC1777295.1 ATP-binding cassette domain-containing protein [Bacteroides uniformis]MDC1778807.1 ATP-binding cassette domain-containing protein [Bacteroides uniformis]